MPWRVADVDKHMKGLTRKEKRAWANVANSVLKSCQKKGGANCDEKAIQQANGVLSRQKERYMAELKVAEAKIKKVGSLSLPASAFLVVEDTDKIATWHLPVKDAKGKPDHKMMAAAYSALLKNYKGPKKAEALAKLKKLYQDEAIELPSEEAAEAIAAELAEWYGDVYPSYYVSPDILSFDQLEDAEDANEVMRQVQDLTDKFFTLTRNIIYSSETDKLAGMRSLTSEYMDRLGMILEGEAEEAPDDTADSQPEMDEAETRSNTDESMSEGEKLSEAEAGQIVSLSEMPTQGDVLRLDIAIIRPGWGNKADRHYYPGEMLQQYAERFVNAKMYETDHRQEEKSTRTWVSTVTEIVGFTEDGAPIGRVVVHDPGFAERLRNLSSAGLLEKMECSILAMGKATPFEMDGIKGKKVTEITDVESVDWVTRAGAGGKALNIAESEGGKVMEDNQEDIEGTVDKEPITDVAENNQDDLATPDAPDSLEEAEVIRIVNESVLPVVSRQRLIGVQYPDEKVLQEAIAAEVTYLKEATGSGQVFGLGETQKPEKKSYNPEAVAEAAERVNKKYFGGHNG